MIEGVVVQQLSIHADDRGAVMHMLRKDGPIFKQFGEIYFSKIKKGFIKGWKKHRYMTQNIAVPVGNIRLVLYDDRRQSETHGSVQEFECGEANYLLIHIPPLIWYAFKALGDEYAMIANCTDLPHNPSESLSIPIDDVRIPYDWT